MQPTNQSTNHPLAPQKSPCTQTNLRHNTDGVALIRRHSHPISKLHIRISRINNIRPIRNRQRSEPLPRPKLATPPATDGENPARDAAVIGVLGGSSVGGVYAVVAGRHGGDVRVDEEVEVAEGVVVCAGAGEGFDGPFGCVGCGHGFGGCDGGGEGGDGGEGCGGEEEGGGELHFGGWWGEKVDLMVVVEG